MIPTTGMEEDIMAGDIMAVTEITTAVTATATAVMATGMSVMVTAVDIVAMVVGMLVAAGIQATANTAAAIREEDTVPELS